MASRRARRRTRRRRAVSLVVTLVVVLLVAALGLQLAGPSIVQPALVALLENQGFAPVRLRVTRVGLTGIGLADIALGPATATAADVRLSPWGLLRGRADRLALTGLRIAATLDADGLAIRGFATTGGSATPPVDTLTLDDAEVALQTAFGAATVRLDGTLTPNAEGVSASLQRASIAAPSLQLSASAIEAELALAGDHARLEVRGQLTDTGKPARVVPLAATLTLERTGDTIAIDASARDAKGQVAITAKGQHALGAGRGSVQVSAAPKPFVPGALQPRDLSPLLGADLPPIDGTLTVAGSVAWTRAALTPDLTVTLKDLGVDLGAARLANGRGALRLDGLAPPTTPPDQRLTASVTVGTMLLPLAVDLGLRKDGAIAVSSLTLGFADGELALNDIVVPPTSTPGAPGAPPADLALPVQVRGTDLGQLLAFLAIDGLSGEGQLDGTLPLRLTRTPAGAPQIALERGALAARGPGSVRYVGGALPTPAGTGAEQVALLSAALKDFRYTGLTIELTRRADGRDEAVLHLTGANPAVLNGRAFVLNIRLDADFDRLATIFLTGFEAAGRLARDLAQKK